MLIYIQCKKNSYIAVNSDQNPSLLSLPDSMRSLTQNPRVAIDRDSGKSILIADVPINNKRKGAFLCFDSSCRMPVFARRGEVKAHHFAHYPNSQGLQCNGNSHGESETHVMCKNWVAVNFHRIRSGEEECSDCEEVRYLPLTAQSDTVAEIEAKVPGCKRVADVMLTSKLLPSRSYMTQREGALHQIAIEIFHTHATDQDKYDELARHGIHKCVEFKTEDVIPCISSDKDEICRIKSNNRTKTWQCSVCAESAKRKANLLARAKEIETYYAERERRIRTEQVAAQERIKAEQAATEAEKEKAVEDSRIKTAEEARIKTEQTAEDARIKTEQAMVDTRIKTEQAADLQRQLAINEKKQAAWITTQGIHLDIRQRNKVRVNQKKKNDHIIKIASELTEAQSRLQTLVLKMENQHDLPLCGLCGKETLLPEIESHTLCPPCHMYSTNEKERLKTRVEMLTKWITA